MKTVHQVMLLVALLLLIGCGGSGGDDTVVVVTPPVNYTPELRSFDMLDSYDIDSRYDATTPVTLSPFEYDGLFNVYWRVNSLEDYIVELRINDRASPNGSFLIHSEWCGEGLWCDQSGELICEYTIDYALACEGESLVDVTPLFPQGPTELYLILQICDFDSPYCEYDYYSVWME